MYQFADEEKRSAELQKELASVFDLAEALFNFWQNQDKTKYTKKVPLESANLALALDVQALRLFRSIIEQCQRSEAFTASILTRTLFETTLASAFLLKKDVRIIVDSVTKGLPAGAVPTKFVAKISAKPRKRTRKHLLSREFRAVLYMAYDSFRREEKDIRSMGKFPGFYHKARRLKRSIHPKITDEVEREAGPAWSYILRRSGTYAGLSVRDLARAIGKHFLRWYETVYHFQSCAAHATDILHFMDMSDGVTLSLLYFSPTVEVYQSLKSAIMMFFVNAHFLHKNLGFGTEVDSALHSLKRKIERIEYSGEELKELERPYPAVLCLSHPRFAYHKGVTVTPRALRGGRPFSNRTFGGYGVPLPSRPNVAIV